MADRQLHAHLRETGSPRGVGQVHADRAPLDGDAERGRPRRRGTSHGGWLFLVDLPLYTISVGLALSTAHALKGLPAGWPKGPAEWPLAIGLVGSSLALSLVFGLYRPGILRSRRRQAAAGARVLVWSAAIAVGGIFLLAEEIPDTLRGLILLYHAAFGLWVVGIRPMLAPALRPRSAAGEGRVLILGGGGMARDLARSLTRSARGSTVIVSFVDDRPPEIRSLAPFRMREVGDVSDLAAEMRADLVVVARKDLPREEMVRLSDALVSRGIRVKILSNVFDRLFESIPFETVHGLHLLQVGETPLRGPRLRLKRLIDLAGTVLGGILILPVLSTIALAIRIGSPGPVFYKQTRIGRRGRPFTMFKFRSMVVHDEDGEHQRYLEDFLKNGAPAGTDEQGQKIYKRADDPRVTRVGHLLRRTSLDELPQLWNVLRGEMSLIGPRPCLPFEYDLYEDWQRRRLDVTPGMTGLWQVTGRSYVTFEDMVLLDLFYIGNWSLGLDAKILLRTAPVILFGKGGL